jgi:hypothetical protein
MSYLLFLTEKCEDKQCPLVLLWIGCSTVWRRVSVLTNECPRADGRAIRELEEFGFLGDFGNLHF